MDLRTIAGALCGVLLVIEVGWHNSVLGVLVVGAFLTLALALSSSWIVVFALLAAIATALRLVRQHWRRTDTGPEQG